MLAVALKGRGRSARGATERMREAGRQGRQGPVAVAPAPRAPGPLHPRPSPRRAEQVLRSLRSGPRRRRAPPGPGAEVPEELDGVVGAVLEGLGDKDTVVRWAAAKSCGRVTMRLPLSFADQAPPRGQARGPAPVSHAQTSDPRDALGRLPGLRQTPRSVLPGSPVRARERGKGSSPPRSVLPGSSVRARERGKGSSPPRSGPFARRA